MTDREASAADLTTALLDEEAARLQAEAAQHEVAVRPDEELPGVGEESMSLRAGIAAGGASTVAMLALLNGLDELEREAATLLAPDIQDTLGVSDLVIAVITVGGLALIAVGGLLLGRLADRFHRPTIAGGATVFWSAVVILTGFVTNALSYFVARAATALGRSNTQTVQGPILADAYPSPPEPGSRSTTWSAESAGSSRPLRSVASSPTSAVTSRGDGRSDRWNPHPADGIALFFLPDPPRGQYEQQATTGEVINEGAPPPISMGATWQRLTAIRTYRTALAAFAALGFMITSVPVFTNLYLEDRFDLDAFERALVTSIPGFLALGVVPFVASRFDRRYAESPPKALVLMGMLFFPVVVLSPLQMSMPTPTLFAIIGAISVVISSAKFAMIALVLASVTRTDLPQGTAIVIAMVFGVGGGGAVIGGLISTNSAPGGP